MSLAVVNKVLKQREYRSVMVDEPIITEKLEKLTRSRDMSMHETRGTKRGTVRLHAARGSREVFSFDLNGTDY
jgi:hypothetical protein